MTFRRYVPTARIAASQSCRSIRIAISAHAAQERTIFLRMAAVASAVQMHVQFMEGTMDGKCELCGEPMPPGEEMFKYHGFSGPCPKPPIQKPSRKERIEAALARMRTEVFAECSLAEEVEGILRDVLAEGR